MGRREVEMNDIAKLRERVIGGDKNCTVMSDRRAQGRTLTRVSSRSRIT